MTHSSFFSVSFSGAEWPVHTRKLCWTLILCRMDPSTPCAQVMDKHRSCDTSSQAALALSAASPWLCAASTTATIIRAVINSCQLHRNTKTPRHPYNCPANNVIQTQTRTMHTYLLSKHLSHSQVIDFYSACGMDREKQTSIYPLSWVHMKKSTCNETVVQYIV